MACEEQKLWGGAMSSSTETPIQYHLKLP